MRKILIPTDFSENAMNAIEYATDLFKYGISEFYIMHAYQDDIYANESLLNKKGLDSMTEKINENSEKALQKTLKKIKKTSPNSKHTYHLISANNLLVDEADTIVEKQNIDIIIMGTKGKTNDKKITFGSYTLQVLRYVRCPVLAIPENYKYTPPKHILFLTDYMIPYQKRELKLLCEMVSPYAAVIDMLYISKSNKLSLRQKDNKEFIREHLCKNKINFNYTNSKHIINSAYKFIKEKNINILVMVNTRHSFLENILFQSTIDELSLNLDIPLLTLQNMKRY